MRARLTIALTCIAACALVFAAQARLVQPLAETLLRRSGLGSAADGGTQRVQGARAVALLAQTLPEPDVGVGIIGLQLRRPPQVQRRVRLLPLRGKPVG